MHVKKCCRWYTVTLPGNWFLWSASPAEKSTDTSHIQIPLYSCTAIRAWFRKISPGDSKNQSTEWVYRESVSSEYNEKSDMKPSIASDLSSETTARRQRQWMANHNSSTSKKQEQSKKQNKHSSKAHLHEPWRGCTMAGSTEVCFPWEGWLCRNIRVEACESPHGVT